MGGTAGRGGERGGRKGRSAWAPLHPICLTEGAESPLVSPTSQLLFPQGMELLLAQCSEHCFPSSFGPNLCRSWPLQRGPGTMCRGGGGRWWLGCLPLLRETNLGCQVPEKNFLGLWGLNQKRSSEHCFPLQGEDIEKVVHLVARRMVAMTTVHLGSGWARSPDFSLLLGRKAYVYVCVTYSGGEQEGVISLEFNSL